MKPITQTIAILAAVAAAAMAVAVNAAPAEARGNGRQIYVEDIHTDKPVHGYSGHAGNYYCDYQRLPERQCDANGQNCRIVGWILRELCQ